jgi:MoxR-like ATPase
VLIVGETGTGKELVAEAIHRSSERTGRFVAVNCGSLSRDLAGSELFGHEKGSFTGAVRRHLGFFKRADSGTLFLDELAEMPLELQPHFLRVLEKGFVLPVGSEQEERVDSRLIAATNRDPRKAIADKALREDLYFRLSVFPIALPPLRERVEDIPLLAEHFLRLASGEDSLPRRLSDAGMARLKAYHWPGNVRELRHVVQRATIMSDPGANELVLSTASRARSASSAKVSRSDGRFATSSASSSRELEHLNGDKKAAAETLGISLNTLYNRLNAYDNNGASSNARAPRASPGSRHSAIPFSSPRPRPLRASSCAAAPAGTALAPAILARESSKRSTASASRTRRHEWSRGLKGFALARTSKVEGEDHEKASKHLCATRDDVAVGGAGIRRRFVAAREGLVHHGQARSDVLAQSPFECLHDPSRDDERRRALDGQRREHIDRDLAGELAKGIDGVTSVKNDLVVKAGSARPAQKQRYWSNL